MFCNKECLGGVRHTSGVKAFLACGIGFLTLASPGAGATTGSKTGNRPPALRIVDQSPLVVRGVRFRPRETVRVAVKIRARGVTKRVRSSSRGSFVTSFSSIVLGRCGTLRIVATGSAGSRAELKVPQPLCPLPL